MKIINFIILNGKYYINNKRSNEQSLFLFEFIQLLREKLRIYELINNLNDESLEFERTYGLLLQNI